MRRLSHLLIVQKPTETQDSGGEPDVAWSEFDQVWGDRRSDGGSESESGGVLTMRKVNIEIHYRAGITEKMRILARSEHTTLNGAINSSVTSITVASAAALPLEGEYRVLVESELMTVTAGQGTTSLTVTRGVDGTTAASHADAKSVHRMDVIDREGLPIHLGWRILTYWVWLAVEIVKASLDVARRILDPKLPIHPVLIRLPASQKSELGLVIYANSITLTPGTVSVQVEVGEILVHAIAEEPAEALRQGDMDRRVSAVEGPAAGLAEGPAEDGGKGGEAA